MKFRGLEAHSYRETCIKQYKAKEKADYQKKKTVERRVKKDGLVAQAGKVKHMGWADAPKGVDQKVVKKRKSHNECTRGIRVESGYKYRLYIEGKQSPNDTPHSSSHGNDAPR